MYFAVIFRAIFCIGVALSIISLFVDISVDISIFLSVLGLGVLCIIYGLYEQFLFKKNDTAASPLSLRQSEPQYQQPSPLLSSQQQTPSVISKSRRLPSAATRRPHPLLSLHHFFSSFFSHVSRKKTFQQDQEQQQQPSPHHSFVHYTPQFEHVKKLFQFHLSPTRQKNPLPDIHAAQLPQFREQQSFKQPDYLFDWEQEEHYLPTGAEHPQQNESLQDEHVALPQQISLSKDTPKTSPLREIQPLPQLVLPQASLQTQEQQRAALREYVHAMIKQYYPLPLIRAEVLKAGWPEQIVQTVFAALQPRQEKKKQLIILGILIAVLFAGLIVLNMQDLLLFGQLVELLSDASPEFYIGASIITLLIFLFIVMKTRKLIRVKKIRFQQEQSRHVQAIKEELQQHKKGFETDFDRLYQLLQEKKKLTVSEVAAGFGVSKSKAEEWGKILKEQGIIELHYPPVGEAELQWKK